jgi:glycosyltransferase involved in cell wall biosynthesis
MISIITVNFNAYDFLDLMIESLERYSSLPHNLIVIDNSEIKKSVDRNNVHQFHMPINIGHGRGLNHGVVKIYSLFPETLFIMFLDIDCHVLTHRWEEPFIKSMRDNDIVCGRGVPAKPLRPSCVFMKKDLARHDWTATENYQGHRITPAGYDVGIKAYYAIKAEGLRVGFLESRPNRYKTLNGEEWCMEGVPLVYHHWHGSHLKERQKDRPEQDLFADKAMLFSKIPWRLP